jgi:hypothetical protein
MKGRQKGRPTKWVRASVEQWVDVNKTGFLFEVSRKWKRNQKTVGTLTVSVGGLRWLPANGKATRRKPWHEVAEWLTKRD